MFYNNFVFYIFFFFLGVLSILGQTVILREITTLFYGNELFYGLGLGIWLLFTGLGSLLAPKFILPSCYDRDRMVKITFVSQFFLFIFLPCLVVLLRFLMAKIVPLGHLPNFWFSLSVLVLVLFIFCFPLGMQFALGVFHWQKKQGKQRVNRAYFWETIGFAFAGLLFSFILATTPFPLSSKLNNLTLKWRYPGLIKTFNSKHNRIIITKNNNQSNYFLNGQLSFTDKETYENKQLLSIIKPFASQTKKVLLLGSPSIALELKKSFNPSDIDYLEMDEKLLLLEKELLPSGTRKITADPRRFLSQNNKAWDLILFSPGNPQTLLINRYFTQESFQQIKKHLNNRGIFVVIFYLPTDYQSKEAIRFGASIYQTLKTVFPAIELLTPEDQIVLIAGNKEIKFDESKIDPQWRQYFWYQIKSKKRAEILKKLTDVKERLNTDLEPVAFFYQQLFWQTMFSFRMPQLVLKMAQFLPVILLFLLLTFLLRGKKQRRLGIFAGCSSFILMSLETLIILMFQTKIGYLYSQISLIFTSVLLGMAIGTKLKIKNEKLKIIFLGYLLVLFLFLLSFSSKISELSIFWFLMAFVSGVIGGAIFALINRIYPMNHYRVQGSKLQKEKNPGYIYAFDLFGGALGAFLTAGFLLPVFGVNKLIGGLTGLVFLIFLVSADPLK